MLGSLPNDIFDVEFCRTKYGEGSEVLHHDQEAEEKGEA
jgi:hypothetical protein